MFTGIIQHVGEVVVIVPRADARGVRITLDPDGWDHTPKPGDSIACNGCCLTLVDESRTDKSDRSKRLWMFDAIPETLAKTTLNDWQPGTRVNLERSLRVGDTLDGHQVQGHVDGTGQVLAIDTGDGWRVRIGLDGALMRYMIPKGSVCLDGVSLTLAAIDADAGWIEVALIPETLERTNLGDRAVGDRVNVECDVLVKTIVETMGRMNSMQTDQLH